MDRKVIKQLITQCINAIYETMVARLIYYCKFLKTLALNKFKKNIYDPCVANLLVNRLQQSILFHVDYCKLIQKYPKEKDSFFGVLREEYQSIFEYGPGKMQVNCRKAHKYLGMILDYSTVGQARIIILDYIDEIINNFDNQIQRVSVLIKVMHQIFF